MLLPLRLCSSFELPPLSFFAFFQSFLCLISLPLSLSVSLSFSAIFTFIVSLKIMTSNNLHSSTPRWSIDLNQDHAHNQQFFLNTSKSPLDASSSSSSFSYPIFANPSQPGGLYNREEAKFYVWHDGSYDNQKLKTGNDEGMKFLICKKEDINENQSENSSSVKWMSSKMRLVKKMASSDQAVIDAPKPLTSKLDHDYNDLTSATSQTVANNNNNSPTNTVRVCSDCNTTKTPLWRSGPRGPKSLCNACGIRQRKARRAMAAAAAAASTNGAQILNGNTATMKSSSNKVQHNKEKKNSNSHLPFKKRCKFTGHQGRGRSKKFGFEDLTIILSKNSAFHQRVFPQDEKEAAILLMALSYGLVHG